MQVSSTSKFWALWKAAGEKQPPVATARASGPEAANFRTPSQSILRKTPLMAMLMKAPSTPSIADHMLPSTRIIADCKIKHGARQSMTEFPSIIANPSMRTKPII
jgi:hypothetical protein